MRYENLSEITATFPLSFPRKWESRSVGTETYREKRFLYSGLTKIRRKRRSRRQYG
ncbi:pilus assembly protein PilS [Neisseria meningitidis]|uniref:pilus assembly protein PilS n=1 Tax=Neisseria meningitidis TaxID=487 RepID=UPI00031ADD1A|nr:pilus assembly protein PilS [Neisseria meningitidis]